MEPENCADEAVEDYYAEISISFEDVHEEVFPSNNTCPHDEEDEASAENRLYDAVNAIELTPVLEELVSKRIFYRRHAEFAVQEYRKFLLLHAMYLNPENDSCGRFLPPDEIGEVWHAHILMTRKYAEDCMFLFGCFLHHDYEPLPNTEAYQRGAEIFRYLYEDRFGEMPVRFTFKCAPKDREDYEVLHRRAYEAGARSRWPQH